MSYEEMLKKVMARLPAKVKERKRFEVPRIEASVMGDKTIVGNFKELLSILNRDAQHLAKFLAKQLATASWIQGSRLVLQGRLRSELIQGKFEEYVEKYVLCKECGNPDTKLVKERRITFMRCEACGCRYPVAKL
jgi:translation initiation factor 2 subunit 2